MLGIKILASDFLKFLVFSWGANTRFTPYNKTVARPSDWRARLFIIIFVIACFNEIFRDTTKYEGHKILGGINPNAPSLKNLFGKQNVLEKTSGDLATLGYAYGIAAQRPSKNRVESLHFRSCLVPSWYGPTRITWNSCWTWCFPIPPGIGKSGMKMNEIKGFRNYRFCDNKIS